MATELEVSELIEIDDEVLDSIKRVSDYAEAHPISLEDLHKMLRNELPPVGDTSEFSCVLKKRFKIVYSIEMQPSGKMKHFSISEINADLPSVEATKQIMKIIGIKQELEQCVHIWPEEIVGEIEKYAINILSIY